MSMMIQGLAVLWLAAAYGDPAFTARIVYHTQGWGETGYGVAAHASGKTPMTMRIGDYGYTEGLGTHAPSETVIMLDGQFARFSADAGVQWQEGQPGSVVMRVELDGVEVFNSGPMKGGAPPAAIDVPVNGGGELKLIVEPAGDGIENDLANWANPVLTPDPDAATVDAAAAVDVARFARVMAWDPAVREGTRATRLETMSEADLFPGEELLPDDDGQYAVPVFDDGRGSIGIEWVERRRVKQLSIAFEGPVPAGLSAEYWKRGERAGSRWQGSWAPLEGEVKQENDTWSIVPAWKETIDARSGVLKVRWIVPADAMPSQVKAIRAYTLTAWRDTEISIKSEGSGEGSVAIYNGEIPGLNDEVAWSLGEALRLPVRYSPARLWELTDRTVLRFRTPAGAFGVAVDDVVKQGSVYVPHADLLVSLADGPTTAAEYKHQFAEDATVLDRVRTMADQTAAQAMRHVHRTDADLGPTLLSLAADNRKFLVQREGEISFDRAVARYDVYDKPIYEPFACLMKPAFGEGPHDYVGRQYRTAWLPVQDLTISNSGVEYRQRTFVAPFGQEAKEGDLPWVRHRALGVAAFRMINRGDKPAKANLQLQFMANAPASVAAEITVDSDRYVVSKDGLTLAVVVVPDSAALQLNVVGSTLRVTGELAAKAEAQCVAYLPHWEGATPADLISVPEADLLADQTEAYWRNVMAPAMHVEVPDAFFNALIPASQMHCLLAARNERGEGVAPWIGSWHYGPLESEGHSVIRGMAFCGQEEFARRALEYYIARYNDQGFLTTGYTVMGTGWHLWMLGEYYALTHDQEWLRKHAPAIEKVCQWIMAERRKTMHTDARGENMPEYGLMPPGVGADWEVYSYYFYLNGYYCAGLRAAAEALADIGWPGAEAMLADASAFKDDIVRSYHHVQGQAPVFPLRDGTWVPEYPTHAYSPMPIEFLYPGEDAGRSWCYDVELGAHHLIPMGILPANGPDAAWMMNHMEDVQFLRPGWFYYEDAAANAADWFNLGGFAKVQPYYARTGEVYAMRDDIKPFVRTYFNSAMSLVNREDLSLWEHFMNGAYNKTHETGYFLHQSRLMLVQERGNELWLAPFITNQWLRDGMEVKVTQAPTTFGNVDYAIASHVEEGFIEATIAPPTRNAPEAIVMRLRHPEDKPMQSAMVTGAKEYSFDAQTDTVRIVPDGKSVTVRAGY